jgi:hypothetical protein
MTRFTQSCSVSVGQATSVFAYSDISSKTTMGFLCKVY